MQFFADNGDGFQGLAVVSGGNEYAETIPLYGSIMVG
jgi:hypothetical protein